MAQEKVLPLHRQKYDGKELGLVIGIDVGTTWSGVSYAILRPDEIPAVLPVTRFSGLETTLSKIPSIIYYNEDLEIKAIGAATTLDTVSNDADYHGWFKCEHFKIHMRPDNGKLNTNGLVLGTLPSGKSAEDVMADFLKYLLDETVDYIQTTHADGPEIWKKAKAKVVFVLGHPNNWKGKPQERYRRAAISAGLVPDTSEGRKRVQFVTEGEASALTCLAGVLGPSRLTVGLRFIIIDAGGGTIDISSYRVRKESPIELEECAPSDSMFAGSVFVNRHGFELLQRILKDSEFDDKETIHDIIRDSFEMKTKREFSGDEDYALVQIGGRRLNDKKLGIRGGFLRLETRDVSNCFSLSIREASDSIRRHLAHVQQQNKEVPVWLVGGFAASPHLAKRLNESLAVDHVAVRRPQTATAKAVADGTVLYYLDQAVKARSAETSYGVTCDILYSPSDPSHNERMYLVKWQDGNRYIGPTFSCILKKGTIIEASQPFAESYMKKFKTIMDAREFTIELIVYDGELPVPKWYLENRSKFRTLCTLRADVSALFRGRKKWVNFDVEVKLGTTELEAVVKYVANGQTKYGSIEILHD